MKTIIIESDINCDPLKEKILKEEPVIIEKFPNTSYDGNDGNSGTGLSPNSLTSRYFWYNVLNWQEAEPLRKWILKGYQNYTETKIKQLHVKCWANVLRKGEQIKPHAHFRGIVDPLDSLCGHLTVKADGSTSTYYRTFIKDEKLLNIPGNFHFFNSGTTHWTDQYNGDSERITIAFDMFTEKAYKTIPEGVIDKLVTLKTED